MPDKWNLEGVSVDINDNMTVEAGLTVEGAAIVFSNLPTSDPTVENQLWANSGVVTVSAG